MIKRDNTVMTAYVDLMDPNRILVLAPSKTDDRNSVSVKVFWAGEKSGRVYGGKAVIPRRLLLSDVDTSRRRRWNERDPLDGIGFMPETDYFRALECSKRPARSSDDEE